MRPVYTTALGAAYCGDAARLLEAVPDASANLVLTSPPFALLRSKEYLDPTANSTQDAYVEWLARFGEIVYRKLRPDGSLVLDIGGAYVRGSPERALYPFRVLLKFCDDLGFKLAQDFYWHNPSKLPSPIEWVNKRKLRAKDSVNNLWWLSKTAWPKANVSKVLVPYSQSMKDLIAAEARPSVLRPSGHTITDKFRRDNGGAIPPNLLQISNTDSNGQYLRACKVIGTPRHPARFPAKLPEFFIKMLTDPGDTVIDIFAGSNTTGFAAETLGRRWLAYDLSLEYLASSAFRFVDPQMPAADMKKLFGNMMSENIVKI